MGADWRMGMMGSSLGALMAGLRMIGLVMVEKYNARRERWGGVGGKWGRGWG
jgi:hypothetical protein